MAAVTSTILAAGGLALSGIQYVQQRKALNDAEDAASTYAQDFLNIETVNKLKGLQVPKLGTELAQQAKDRTVKETMDRVGETGVGALGQTTNIVDASNTQDLKIAAGIEKEEARINEMIAKGDQSIEDTRAGDEKKLAMARITGAGEAAAAATEGSRSAAEQFGQGVGGVGTSLYAAKGLYDEKGAQIIL
tara:strand:+ start:1222 stop:1794 length:573 start_codon:yes stop_codon:yes gene_type:complete